MKLCIHRGSHQIGGMAVEFSTDTTRLLIDMGDELSVDPGFVSTPLQIPGVTDANGSCDGVLFTHYHGDHVGQLQRINRDIPLYMGPLARDILLLSEQHRRDPDQCLCQRLEALHTFQPGQCFQIGDIQITPYSIDHSACDSYMFLLEADGKKVLYTGDFRLHGIRGGSLPKLLEKCIRKVNVVITEGTTISRPNQPVLTEWDLQKQLKSYLQTYKYVFVLCASTNLDRIFSFARAVPRGKYCLCDRYQMSLVQAVSHHWAKYSSFYEIPKLLTYSAYLEPKFQQKGGLLFVRDNQHFSQLIRKFDQNQSIMLYSMWDGYRTKPGSSLPEFLNLTAAWKPLHTSGHASSADIRLVLDQTDPELVIPMHTDAPDQLQAICPNRTVQVLSDGEELLL